MNGTIVCAYCGERVWNSGIRYSEGQPICPCCYWKHFLTCKVCGKVIHRKEACYENGDKGFPQCRSCYSRRCSNETIHENSYMPVPTFFGDGPRYMVVELELEGVGENDRSARELLAAANWGAKRVYIKHSDFLDGGFALVSHPMSLEYHICEMPWADVLDTAAAIGCRSHQTTTCGLGIHISREAFGTDAAERDMTVARVLRFFRRHWEELLQFSRRTPGQLARWAERRGCRGHLCIDLEGANSVAFRMFRGTLNRNTLIATLQLLDRICDMAVCMSDEAWRGLSWPAFAAGCTQPELVQYLKEQRLYINEPVSGRLEL